MSEEIKNEVEVTEETLTVEEPETKPEEKTVTMSQDELNALIGREKGRVKSKYADYDDLKAKLEEFETAAKKREESELTQIELLQKQREEALKQAEELAQTNQAVVEKANQRLIKSEFRLLAKEIGVRSDALDDAFLLVDKSEIQVDEDGNVAGVQEALEALKKSKAYLFGSKEYADPTPGQREAKRESSKAMAQDKLKDLQEKARKSGRIEDRIAYAEFKKQLGL